MDWTEIKIYTTSFGIEPVCGRLLNIGISGFVIRDSNDFEEFLQNKDGNWDYVDDDLMELRECETCVTVYIAENSQGAETLSALKTEMDILKSIDVDDKFGRLAVELSGVREEDWANNWKQYFKPISIGDKLVIKPSWENLDNSDGKTILEIDPGSSFGTGQHYTTALCLELLEKNLNGNEKLLDLGCGSGILSIGGILLGASSATAVDIDLNSVRIAGENAQNNGISADIYSTFCGNIISDDSLCDKIGGEYDIIVANIVADVLIAMGGIFPKFLKKDGTIIVSGIISERANEVISVLEENGFKQISCMENGGWVAVSLSR